MPEQISKVALRQPGDTERLNGFSAVNREKLKILLGDKSCESGEPVRVRTGDLLIKSLSVHSSIHLWRLRKITYLSVNHKVP